MYKRKLLVLQLFRSSQPFLKLQDGESSQPAGRKLCNISSRLVKLRFVNLKIIEFSIGNTVTIDEHYGSLFRADRANSNPWSFAASCDQANLTTLTRTRVASAIRFRSLSHEASQIGELEAKEETICDFGTQFQCVDSGECVRRTVLCDGRTDCEDGSDEDCPSPHCLHNFSTVPLAISASILILFVVLVTVCYCIRACSAHFSGNASSSYVPPNMLSDPSFWPSRSSYTPPVFARQLARSSSTSPPSQDEFSAPPPSYDEALAIAVSSQLPEYDQNMAAIEPLDQTELALHLDS